MSYEPKTEEKSGEKYGALVVHRDFKPKIYQELEKDYGPRYDQALAEAREYFKKNMPDKSRIIKTEENVIYVDFSPYRKSPEDQDNQDKLQGELALQRQKFSSLMNIPVNQDDDLERVTEIIM